MAMPSTAKARWTAALTLEFSLRRIAHAFAPAQIEAMPLKGAALLWGHARDPSQRAVSDLDLLVRPERFDEASDRLESLGWRLRHEERGGRERLFLSPRGMPVDLHRAPFQRGFFRLSPEALFARATADTALGAPLYLPSAPDLYAHLVGHIAQTFLFEHHWHHLDDLAFLAAQARLDAAAMADHLHQTGLGSAAIYVLDQASRQGDAFAAALLSLLDPALPRRLGARLIQTLIARLPERRGLGLLPPNLLHRAPRDSARFIQGVWQRRRGR